MLFSLLLLIGLLGLLSGIVWWQLPTMLNWGLTQLLQQQGLTNITVQISDAGVSHASIERLDFTYQEPDTALQIQLKQVRLDYNLSQLMKGRAESLSIGSAILKLDYRPDPQSGKSPTLPNIELLLAAYDSVNVAGFPIDIVRLPDISISHNLASDSVSTFDVIQLRAELTKLKNRLVVDVFSADQQSLHLTNDEDSGWRIRYFDVPELSQATQNAEQRQAVFIGSLNRVDQSLEFSAELKPGLAQRAAYLAESLGASIDLSEMAVTGKILSNKATPGLAISATILARDLSYKGNRFETVNGEFDVQIAQFQENSDNAQQHRKLELNSHNRVSLKNVSYAGWQADKITLSGNSEVSLAEDVTKIASSNFELTIGKLQQASELELSGVSFAGKISTTIGAEQWQADLAESWQFTSQYGRLGETEFQQGLALSSTQPAHFKGAIESTLAESPLRLNSETESQGTQPKSKVEQSVGDSIKLEKTSLQITAPSVKNKSLTQHVLVGGASLQINHARINQGKLVAGGSLSIPQLKIIESLTKPSQQPNKRPQQANKKNPNDWQLDNFNQTFELDGDRLTSRGSVDSVARDLQIETTSKHDFMKQRGESEFRFKAIDFKNPERLNRLVAPLKLPVKLVTGEIELIGRARWVLKREEWQAVVDIDTQLNHLGGAYDETYFSGVNGQLSLQVYPEILSETPLRLSVSHADVGVPITDMVVEFSLKPSKLGDWPVVDIMLAKTQVLQGSISLKPAAYDLNRVQQNLQVMLENINLSELVSLQQINDIEATGLVTGQLPLVLEDGKISIHSGQLYAIAPGGTLRYHANKDALQANKYAEKVILALQNFNYDVLRADTEYDPDGTLLLKLRLQGNNPDFEAGRQVNLNINLEQNVLKLFESLRLIEGVSDTLDKRVQDFYQRTTSP